MPMPPSIKIVVKAPNEAYESDEEMKGPDAYEEETEPIESQTRASMYRKKFKCKRKS